MLSWYPFSNMLQRFVDGSCEVVPTMITRKSLLGSRNLYRFVTQTSHDRMDPTAASYRLYSDLAAVIAVSNDLRSLKSSHAGRAQGKIMKPRSCVVLSSALGWRVSVHHLQANLGSRVSRLNFWNIGIWESYSRCSKLGSSSTDQPSRFKR